MKRTPINTWDMKAAIMEALTGYLEDNGQPVNTYWVEVSARQTVNFFWEHAV